MTECLTCKSNSGEKRISPGEIIYTGKYWLVEHAYPSGLLGWVVIVLKRHTEKLHELSQEEWNELALLNFKTVKLLHKLLNSRKEYSCCFATGEGFKHIHFHVIPNTDDFDERYKGVGVFHYLKKNECDVVPEDTVREFCVIMRREFGK